MANLETSNYHKVISAIIARTEKDGGAELSSVLSALYQEGTLPSPNYDNIAMLNIEGLLKKRGYMSTPLHADQMHFTLNPNFEFEQSIEKTNTSIRRLNKTLIVANILIVISSIASALYIALTYYKDDTTTLRNLTNQINSQNTILKNIDTKIKKDTVYILPKKQTPVKGK